MPIANIPEFSSKDDTDAINAAFDEAGCAVVHNVFDADLCEQIKTELESHLNEALFSQEDKSEDFYPGNTRRITGLVARTPSIRNLIVHPVTTGLCDHHLLPNCEQYNVHVTAGLVVGPGARRQILHREEDPFSYFPVPRPNLVIASMAAISEFTVDNGGTLIVPGSHRWEVGRQAQDDEIVSAEMPPGSMLFWAGGTLHGAGSNITESWRHGIIISYSLGWLRQEENQYLDLPDHVLDEINDEMKDRLGISMHGSLGLYDPRIRNTNSSSSLPKNLG